MLAGSLVAYRSTDIPSQEVTAFTRTCSVEKPEVLALQERGIAVVAADIRGSFDELVELLTGFDVVISAIDARALHDEPVLADAAKAAGVQRFVPCFFATIVPPRGILTIRDYVSSIFSRCSRAFLNQTECADSTLQNHRRKTISTTSRKSTSHTPSSTSAGGTRSPCSLLPRATMRNGPPPDRSALPATARS